MEIPEILDILAHKEILDRMDILGLLVLTDPPVPLELPDPLAGLDILDLPDLPDLLDLPE
jgi:hypothetical protein